MNMVIQVWEGRMAKSPSAVWHTNSLPKERTEKAEQTRHRAEKTERDLAGNLKNDLVGNLKQVRRRSYAGSL